jgi:glycosyltransferase involved in cell wall biosynthesis
VGSNIPDQRHARDTSRAELCVEPEAIVLCGFGQRHHSRRPAHIVEAANHAASHMNVPVHVLNLGGNAPAMAGLDPAVRLHAPGWLDPTSVARMLAAADIYLAPFEGGVSTRRGSMMAALQHAVPVVATMGRETGPMLKQAAPHHLCMVEANDRSRFAVAVADLARDARQRSLLGAAGRRLYEERFAWEPLAKGLIEALHSTVSHQVDSG